MRRVVALGPGGSGKTELARAMSCRTGLPVVHLAVCLCARSGDSVVIGTADGQVRRYVATL